MPGDGEKLVHLKQQSDCQHESRASWELRPHVTPVIGNASKEYCPRLCFGTPGPGSEILLSPHHKVGPLLSNDVDDVHRREPDEDKRSCQPTLLIAGDVAD